MPKARKIEAISGGIYIRHRPEQTLLYQLVERYYPDFSRLMLLQGTPLPAYVAREFEDYLGLGTDRLTVSNIKDDAAKRIAGQCSLAAQKSRKIQGKAGNFQGFGAGDDGLRHVFRQVPGNNSRLDCPRLAVYSSYTSNLSRCSKQV